jgi:hypothetical protein
MKTFRTWLCILGLSVLGASSACVVGPTNGDAPLCGADAPIEISGYAPDERASGPGYDQVLVEVGPRRDGPFSELVRAPISFTQGETWGAWTTGKVVVPRNRWGNSDSTAELFLRVRYAFDPPNGNKIFFYTYDNPSLGTGQTVACVSDRIQAGASRTDAAALCASSQSPLVRVTAPVMSQCGCSAETTARGNVMIHNIGDVDAHRCDVAMNGLFIYNDSPLVVSLPRLRSVRGLSIYYDVPGRPTEARRVELPGLTRVDGPMAIQARGLVDGTLRLDVGLPDITTVTGKFYTTISGTGGVSLQGLNGLTSIGGDMDLVFHGQADGARFLPQLETLGGRMMLHHDAGITKMMPSLTSIGSHLWLLYHGTSAQSELVGFDKLRSVGADMLFDSSPWQTFDDGEPAFSQLGSIGGTLTLNKTQLQSLRLGAPPLSVGSLSVTGNPQLISLPAGADMPLSSTGTLTVQNNFSLGECQVTQFVSEQVALGFTGQVTTGGNAECLPNGPPDQ